MLDKLKKTLETINSSSINKHEKIAITNLISVAKERVWISDPMRCLEYKTETFEEDVDHETIEQIKKSVQIVENFLNNQQ